MSTSMIAATLYSVRQFTQTRDDLAKTLRRVKQIGYDAVQFSRLGQIQPEELRAMLDGEGLVVCSTHASYTELVNEFDTLVANHHTWGCKHVALAALPPDMRSKEGYHRFAREANDIGRRLAKEGITFSYHNHSFEFEKYDGRLGMDIIYEDSDPKLVCAEIDTYWVQHGGGDPAAWIRKLAGRQPLVHFKDMEVVDNQPVFAEVGEGNLNWPAIVAACREVGVRWYIVEQDTSRIDPFHSIAISLKNMQAMGLV